MIELESFAQDYRPPLLSYVDRPTEKGRATAYELGRRAMTSDLGLLNLVRVHHDVSAAVLATARDVDDARAIAARAATFLLESLASFEMSQRGFMAGEALPRRDATPDRPSSSSNVDGGEPSSLRTRSTGP